MIGQPLSSTNWETGLVESQTDYDANIMPWKTYAFGKLQQTLAYNANGTLASATDGNNHTTSFGNWKRGIPQTIAFADGTGKSAVVDDLGQIASITNEVGTKTCYGYDAMGRVNRIIYPSEVQAGQCNQDNWLETTISFAPAAATPYGLPNGHWRRTESTGTARDITYYDALWRPVLKEVYDTANTWGTIAQTITRYDADGNVVFASYPQRVADPGVYSTWANPGVSPNASGTWTTYDALGRSTQTQQTSELGWLTTTAEYLPGFQTRITNPRGYQTVTEYQAFDQPVTDAPSGVTRYAGANTAATEIHRDRFGKPTVLKRRNGDGSLSNSRYYVYDGHQRLCKTLESESGATVIGYDNAGNVSFSASGLPLSSLTDCEQAAAWNSGRRSDRSYDPRNRLSDLSFPDSNGNQHWIYTPDGLPAQVTTWNDDGTTAIVNAYSYNARRLLSAESVQQPNWYSWNVVYGYDAYGHVAGQNYPTGLYVAYDPNALGQPSRAGDFAYGVSYYPNGAIQQFTYGNGIVHTMAQNARQLPSRVTDGSVADFTYAYDAHANPVTLRDVNAVAGVYSGNRDLEYDGLDRLTSAHFHYWLIDTWGYDALDNIRSKSHYDGFVNTPYEYWYDPSQRLTNIVNLATNATVTGLGYDVQGNLANKNGQTYRFDYGNRLREVPNKESYRYDAHGRRVQSSHANGARTLFQYTQAGQLVYRHDEAASLAIDQIYLGGSLVAMRERNVVSGVTATRYQHTDPLGSPVAITGQAGQVLDRNNYEPYGAVLSKPAYNGMGFAGHPMDGATGMSYMQQRYYDPQIGRFLSMDPVTADTVTGGNFNRYWYANNNPYRFVDPDGRQACSDACMGMRSKSDGFSGVRTSFRSPIDMGAVAFREQNYTTKPGVTLSQPTSIKVGNLADDYNEATGKKLVVTDGSRTAQDQASRMHYKISNGEGVRLYANRAAANEVMNAYNDAVGAGLGRNEVISSMAGAISDQMSRGVYISGHLRDGAVDFRSRDLTGADRQAFREAAGTSKVLLEGVPPHFHVEF